MVNPPPQKNAFLSIYLNFNTFFQVRKQKEQTLALSLQKKKVRQGGNTIKF